MTSHFNPADFWLAVVAFALAVATSLGVDRVAADLAACAQHLGLSYGYPRAVAAATAVLIGAGLAASIRFSPGGARRLGLAAHILVLGLAGACGYAELALRPSASVVTLVVGALVGLVALVRVVDVARGG